MRRTKFKPEDFEPRLVIPCAHSGCQHPAIISKRLSTGWANLCKGHDLFHAQLEANEFCEQNGLYAREEKTAWIRKKPNSSQVTPFEHWTKVLETPPLVTIAYEMARNYLARHASSVTPEVT
jgi:hypothetical protein